MLFKVGTRGATRYQYIEDSKIYYIDVAITGPDDYEAWITEENSGVSSLMFAVPAKQPTGEYITYAGFMELVIGNLDACGAESFIYKGEEA